MWRAYMSKRGRTTNQSTKFQNSKVTWFTVLTVSLRKPGCRALKLFSKNLEKFTISGLKRFQHYRAKKNCIISQHLQNFSIVELGRFQHCRT